MCCGQGLGSKPNIRAGAGLGGGWVRRSVLCGVVVERRGRLICVAEGLSLPAAQLIAACLDHSWSGSGAVVQCGGVVVCGGAVVQCRGRGVRDGVEVGLLEWGGGGQQGALGGAGAHGCTCLETKRTPRRERTGREDQADLDVAHRSPART